MTEAAPADLVIAVRASDAALRGPEAVALAVAVLAAAITLSVPAERR